jgi:alginate O-acetyltransferase complex protein AlgI
LMITPAGKFRLVVLTIISYLFYMGFDHRYGYLLAGVTTVAYIGARVVASSTGRYRTFFLIATVVATLAPLLIFKYLPGAGWGRTGWVGGLLGGLLLPVGLSFYTFQAVGYVIDVYVDRSVAERDPIMFGAFMSFFPQLMAGPIERAGHLIPQLSVIGRFDYGRSVEGLRSLLAGFFLKIVIADTMAPLVERVYTDPTAAVATDIALATTYFSFQVYADFAGYSLIAIGSARLLGVELLPNFAQPYLSQSLPEFWRTWHMTLSAWFRDYLFTPLHFQWRRFGTAGLAAALFMVFTVVGIWHGAGWKYAMFGAIHGVLVAASTLTRKTRDRWWRWAGVPAAPLAVYRALHTFGIVTITFVLFRATDAADAVLIYEKLWLGPWTAPSLPMAWPAAFILLLLASDVLARRGWSLGRLPQPTRWVAYHIAAASIAATLVVKFMSGTASVRQFIYFNF